MFHTTKHHWNILHLITTTTWGYHLVYLIQFFLLIFLFQLYARPPEVVNIAYATKLQLYVEYGVVDNVAIFNVRSTIFSPAYIVAYALHHILGHWNFRLADHYVKDVVLVKFKSAFSTSRLRGTNLKQGTITQRQTIMMATKVS